MTLIPYEFDAERFSRWMAYVLRHNPTRYGLQPDRHGYIDLEEFLAIARRRYPRATPERLRELITGGSGRFEVSGNRLRARYGHSIPVQPTGAPVVPPAFLYYGIEAARRPEALAQGLKPLDRQWLHLSRTREEAQAIISKKAQQPAVLRIDAAGAHAAGVPFYEEGSLYLAPYLPAAFLAEEALSHQENFPS